MEKTESNFYERYPKEEVKKDVKEVDNFRKIEKKFKKVQPHSNRKIRRTQEENDEKKLLEEVIDFKNSKIPQKYKSIIQKEDEKSTLYQRFFNTKELQELKGSIFSFKSFPGFYFISSAVTPSDQRKWLKKCMKNYPEKPNITNLEILVKNKKIEKIEKIWENKEMLKELSWATLGYQYDWTNRKYYKINKVEFPKEFGDYVSTIAEKIDEKYKPYIPEAAIINYYSENQKMGGHKDNAEYEMKKPIVSLSFGNSAIFLLGGETKDIEPIPMIIHSGDIIILGGRSRYCYHGVARIMNNTIPKYLMKSEKEDKEMDEIFEYLKDKRINMNVRQVFPLEEEN